MAELELIEAIDLAVAENNPPSVGRHYLGGSQIGEECERKLWYSFRWAMLIVFGPRILRLFDRGHREEPALIKYLTDAGVDCYEVDEKTGEQFAVSFAWGHGGGHLDGALKNLPDHPEWHLAEFKTSSDKEFKKVQKAGVRSAKPVHYAQMQIYMHLSGLKFAAYIVVNKNDDELYFERVEYDRDEGARIEAKAEAIVAAESPPTKLSEDPTFFKCRFCDYKELCHYEATPQANCRTCVHSTPEKEDGRWLCEKKNLELTRQLQKQGCDQHRFIPHLIENWAEFKEMDGESVKYKNTQNGKEFLNGEPGYSSIEISLAQDVRIIGDETVDQIKQTFDGRVAG